MSEQLQRILGMVDADYADIRYEIKKAVLISFQGKDLTQIGSNSTDGYVMRVLKDGGMSSVVFTQEKDAVKAAKSAVENARLISKNIKKPVKLAKTEVIKDTFHSLLFLFSLSDTTSLASLARFGSVFINA